MIPRKLPGVSLFDLIIVVVVAGMFFATTSRFLIKKNPSDNLQMITYELNNLATFAQQRAIVHGVVRMNISPMAPQGFKVLLSSLQSNNEFEPVKDGFIKTFLEIPSHNVLINNKDSEPAPLVTHFFSSGNCESLVLEIQRIGEKNSVKLKLNSFSCRFDTI